MQSLGKLRQLRYLDLAKNRIESLDTDVSGCESLEDLLLSSNMLQHLPDSIGTTGSPFGLYSLYIPPPLQPSPGLLQPLHLPAPASPPWGKGGDCVRPDT